MTVNPSRSTELTTASFLSSFYFTCAASWKHPFSKRQCKKQNKYKIKTETWAYLEIASTFEGAD